MWLSAGNRRGCANFRSIDLPLTISQKATDLQIHPSTPLVATQLGRQVITYEVLDRVDAYSGL